MSGTGINSTIRQHAGAGLVAAAVITASLVDGLFDPTGYAVASILVWAAVIAGLVGRGLPAIPVGQAAAVAGICLAGAMLLSAISMAWADDQGRAFEEALRLSLYLGLFTLAACTASRRGRAEWVAGLTVGLGVVAVLALLSYLQPGLLESRPASDIPNAAGRLAYPLGYWNGMAALLAGAMVLLAHAGSIASGRALRSLATSALPLVALGIWLTESRGGEAAAAIALVALVAAAPRRSRQSIVIVVGAVGAVALVGAAEAMNHLTTGVPDSAMRADGDRMSALVVVVTALTFAGAWLLDDPIQRAHISVSRRARIAVGALACLAIAGAVVAAHPAERFREFKAPPETAAQGAVGRESSLSSDGRWQFWGEAVSAFESAPVAGLGAGGYERWWAQNATAPLFVLNPHSLPLQQAAELGLLGILLFLGFLAAVAVAARRRLASGRDRDAGVLLATIVAAGVCALVDWTWEIPAAFGPAIVAAGLLTSYAPSRGLARDSYWLGAGTVSLAWVAMIAAGLVVIGQLELQKSRDAAANQNIAAAIGRADDARTVLPWSSAPYTQLALLEEARGNYGGALAQLQKAEVRDSNDWRLFIIEARLQARRGNGLGAARALGRARTLNRLLPE